MIYLKENHCEIFREFLCMIFSETADRKSFEVSQ